MGKGSLTEKWVWVIYTHSHLISLPVNPKFHVVVIRETSFPLPPKQAFLSLFTYFSPSDKRSASQKRLLAFFFEPNLCRIPPNRAHTEGFRNACAGIGWICAGIEAVAPSLREGLRRRSDLSGVQVTCDAGAKSIKISHDRGLELARISMFTKNEQ
jgi:hypothetical protein